MYNPCFIFILGLLCGELTAMKVISNKQPFFGSRRNWKSRDDRFDFNKDVADQARFRPPGYQKYVENKRKESQLYPSYMNFGSGQETVKDLIQKGKFFNAGFESNSFPVQRVRREPMAKEKSAPSILSEISSVEVLPVIRKSRTIECQREPDGVVNCHQDDLFYKIRLKHPDLPQDVLETLITNLYARLFKATTEKRKRDGARNEQKLSDDSPFIIVLPQEHESYYRTAASERPISKIRTSTEADYGDDLIIECAPSGSESVRDFEKSSLKGEVKSPKSYVYSCKWRGNRSAEQQKVVVEKVRRGPPLQSFKVLIDPAKVGLNLLPITVVH